MPIQRNCLVKLRLGEAKVNILALINDRKLIGEISDLFK